MFNASMVKVIMLSRLGSAERDAEGRLGDLASVVSYPIGVRG